ncbi:MAG: alanine racemase [Deltaproteobacteria bacterium]|jgi:predicted amino acid racemase|nr:alanine racemase [Deltaproteobacteria bacterium]
MSKIVFDTQALAENAQRLLGWASGLGLEVVPVLKAVREFPPAVETLIEVGFSRFGLPKFEKHLDTLLTREAKTLIQLTAPSSVAETVYNFGRSLQSSPKVLRLLDRAAGAANLTHEVVLMVNLGDNREGLEPSLVSEALDFLLGLPNLVFRGFGSILTCLGDLLPGPELFDSLRSLVDLAASRKIPNPVLSLGGSVMCAFVNAHGPGPITQLRLGDPFLLGYDVYRETELPAGPWRRDVCRLEAEVVEVSLRPKAHNGSLSPRALLDMGRFQAGKVYPCSPQTVPLEGLECLWPGAAIVGSTAGYIVLELSDCQIRPEVGDLVSFRPGYWPMATAFRSRDVKVELETPATRGRSQPQGRDPLGHGPHDPGPLDHGPLDHGPHDPGQLDSGPRSKSKGWRRLSSL